METWNNNAHLLVNTSHELITAEAEWWAYGDSLNQGSVHFLKGQRADNLGFQAILSLLQPPNSAFVV